MNTKEIGGYFHLELNGINNCPNSDGVLLNSGRNSLEYILLSIPVIKHIWIPYFTCNAVLEPLIKLNIPYSFYHINENLELSNQIDTNLAQDDFLLYINYFGIKDLYVKKLLLKYEQNLIIDNSQALYFPHSYFSFYSPRKFVGIPDGGIAFSGHNLDIEILEKDLSFQRCSHLLMRFDLEASDGYNDFKENSLKLRHQSLKKMSCLTKALLNGADFKAIREKRLSNFHILHSALESSNHINIKNDSISCPMVYPYYTKRIKLREILIKNKVYVATYWPNVMELCSPKSVEYQLCQNLIPIPIDQRYSKKEMMFILGLILQDI